LGGSVRVTQRRVENGEIVDRIGQWAGGVDVAPVEAYYQAVRV
jgi:hypothetical protein